MNTVTVITKSPKANKQIKKQVMKEVFKYALHYLQELIESYVLTGNEYYWDKAKKQQEICDKLYFLTH